MIAAVCLLLVCVGVYSVAVVSFVDRTPIAEGPTIVQLAGISKFNRLTVGHRCPKGKQSGWVKRLFPTATKTGSSCGTLTERKSFCWGRPH